MLAKILEKSRNKHRGHRGNERYLERPGQGFLFGAGHLGNLFRIVQNHLRAVDNLPAHLRWHHRVRFPVEQADIKLFLQFLYHQTQGGLGEITGFGRFPEVPILLYGNDIPQLLECHLILD